MVVLIKHNITVSQILSIYYNKYCEKSQICSFTIKTIGGIL